MNSKIFLNKRILITQSSLRMIAGSEINTLELATYLRDCGADITVYTHFFSEPISPYFESANIKVVTDESLLKLFDFDYVWVHHQVIPSSFVDDMAKGSSEQFPIFIFLHMSGLKTHFLEQAYIWGLEERIASKILFVSDEAEENVKSNSINPNQIDSAFYRNPVPPHFLKFKHTDNETVRRVLIVSNHPAPEVCEAAQMLRESGVEVVMSGEGQKEYKLINPSYLNSFDVVISIGKTVQYCLVMKIPVYIYDIWGGPGYLDSDNEKDAVWHNLSGRGFEKKDPISISEEIINGYQRVKRYQKSNHYRFVKEFSMDAVIPDVFSKLEARRIVPFDTYYKQYLSGALIMLKYKFYHENLLIKKTEEIDVINSSFENEKVLHDIEIAEKTKKIVELSNHLERINKSRAYKLSLFLVNLLKRLKNFIR